MAKLLEQEPKTIAPQEQETETAEQQEAPDDLAYITQEIRRMQEPELDATEQDLDALTYVHALNTEIKTNKRFEPTTEQVATRTHAYTKGEIKTANAREEIANQIEVDTLNDPTIPNLQDALRNPKDGILPLLHKRDELIEGKENDAAEKLQKTITSATEATIKELPDTSKGKQIKAFLEHITAAPIFTEEKKVEEQPTEIKEIPVPSLRKEFQKKIVASLREVDVRAANILDTQLHNIERMQTDKQREEALEQLKGILKGRLEKRINWEQTEARIEQLGRLLVQEKTLEEKPKPAQTAFAA